MPPQKSKKFNLPKHLLDMKFMKKTKEKEEHRQEDEDRRTMFSHEITNGMLNDGPKFIEEPSLVPLLGLLEGRFSFRGMNPEIERLMMDEAVLRQEEEERRLQESKEKSVSDREMADHMGPLAHSMSRKFVNKKQRKHGNTDYQHNRASPGFSRNEENPRKKFKFMKPSID